jgi:inorganic pyrophosphatase
MSDNIDWTRRLDLAVTFCDRQGVVTALNPAAEAAYAPYGGAAVGQSLVGCHPEPARSLLLELLADPRPHIYATENGGRCELIVQIPWADESGQPAGLVELQLPLPAELDLFQRGQAAAETVHPHIYYGLNYGFLPGVLGLDGEELDAYLLGVFQPVECFTGTVIAVIHRTDDADDKLVVAPPGVSYSDEQIAALTEFQERFFHSVILRGAA